MSDFDTKPKETSHNSSNRKELSPIDMIKELINDGHVEPVDEDLSNPDNPSYYEWVPSITAPHTILTSKR